MRDRLYASDWLCRRPLSRERSRTLSVPPARIRCAHECVRRCFPADAPASPCLAGAVAGAPKVMLPDTAAAAGGFSAGAAGRRAPGADKRAHTWARVDALGLQSLARLPDAEWVTDPSPFELRLYESLRASSEKRVRTATDPGKLGTAMSYIERLAAAMPSRPLFRQRGRADDAEAAGHNNVTFELLGEFIRIHGSIQPGQLGATLKADTIADYLSAAHEALSATLWGRVTDAERDPRRRRTLKSMVREDGPQRADREKVRLAFRGQHFQRVAKSAFDRFSAEGFYRWTVALVMWQCLMRPGEPGCGDGKLPFDPSRGFALSNVAWWGVEITGNGRPAVCVMIVPVKDWRAARMPIVISALQSTESNDPCCAYSVLLKWWRIRSRAVCRRAQPCSCAPFCQLCQQAPVFQSPSTGRVWRSPDALVVVRDMCAAIGEPCDDMAGYSLRIGGATDVVAMYGVERAERITKQRGRWWSDIFFIYQRSSADEQMEASAGMAGVTGHSLEALLPGWVQPSRGWGRARSGGR